MHAIQNDEVYLSFDANFGLCRKRSAGRSVHPPLHSETLFFKQKDVNEFVENYGSIKSQNVEVRLLRHELLNLIANVCCILNHSQPGNLGKSFIYLFY